LIDLKGFYSMICSCLTYLNSMICFCYPVAEAAAPLPEPRNIYT
jgi:hypothetical protein